MNRKLYILLSLLLPLPVLTLTMDTGQLSDQLRALQDQLGVLQEGLQRAPAVPAQAPQRAQKRKIVLQGEIPVLVSGILMEKPLTEQLVALLRKNYPAASFNVYNLMEYEKNKKDVGIVVIWHSTRLVANIHADRVNRSLEQPIVILIEMNAEPDPVLIAELQKDVDKFLEKKNVPTFALGANINNFTLFHNKNNNQQLKSLGEAFSSGRFS
jgi:hypothetical protein